MTCLVPVNLTWFGKLPSRGDFVRSAEQGGLTRMLDQWIAQGLELLTADPRWKQIYDQAPTYHFAFLGVRSQVALAGYLMPSVDASERRFPFVVMGSFDVAKPLDFMGCSPLAMTRLWNTLESSAQKANTATDAFQALTQQSKTPVEIDVDAAVHLRSFLGFLESQTLGSLNDVLRREHPQANVRSMMLALGLLLQSVPTSGVSMLEKGLKLPLPSDPLYRPQVATLWMKLIVPFVSKGNFELVLFLRKGRESAGDSLCVGFAGATPMLLEAMLNPDQDAQYLLPLADNTQWVEEHLQGDYALHKLSSYLLQPQLSLEHALQTFDECFLGA